MLHLDGSYGEGGGQILRSALSLSCITGRPFRIENIRAKRSKPGLRPQHLVSVQAAAAISRADVEGAELGSTRLVFRPSEVHGGTYRFDIGTAGAVGLVIQTVLYPLCFAAEASRLNVTGGTHVPWAPCYHYLELQWLPFLKRLGIDAGIRLLRSGFYPSGGGEVEVTVRPVTEVRPLDLPERGGLRRLTGISAFANLRRSVAERQERRADQALRAAGYTPEIRIVELSSRDPNTLMLLLAEYDFSSACYYSLGARGKPAERVAEEAVEAFLRFERSGGVFDEYLADQILLPLSLSPGKSRYRTPSVTRHLLTNWEVVRRFMPRGGRIEAKAEDEGWITLPDAGNDGSRPHARTEQSK